MARSPFWTALETGSAERSSNLLGDPDELTWWKRDDVEQSATVNASSTLLSFYPTAGAWTLSSLGRGSCSNTVQTSVFIGSSVTFKFKGTHVKVNIIKDLHGAPYSVTLDGADPQTFNSFAPSQQCASDFEASNLALSEHTVIVTHEGSQVLSASGNSTIYFVSIDYTGTPTTPSVNPAPAGSKSPPVGPIVGGVVGGVALLFIAVVAFWWLRRRRKQKPNLQDHEPKQAFNPDFQSNIHNPPPPPPESYLPHPSVDPYPNHPVTSSDTTPFIHNSQVTLASAPQRRGKADDVYYHEEGGRFVRSSPWASLTSQNQSGLNIASGSSGFHHQAGMSGYSGGTESRAPTSIVTHQYPPAASSGTGGSSEPSSYDLARPIQQQQQQQQQLPPSRHGPPSRIQQPLPQQMYAIEPSEVGESVIIDRSDYIPPPSYSPPATNHARQSSTRSKALYDVSRTDGRDSLVPPFPTDLRNTTSQNLSATDVDIIARRVVDLMRSGSSVGGSSVTGFGEGTGSDYSTATADHPQVQQAVRRLLAKEEPHLLSSSQPRPEKS